MADSRSRFEASGGSERAEKVGACFLNSVSAIDAAVKDYDAYRARCILSGTVPVSREDLETTGQLMAHFTSLMMIGCSVEFTAPGPAEIAAILKRALFGEQDKPDSDAVTDEPGSV